MNDLRFHIYFGDHVQHEEVLQYSPEGWDDSVVTLERSATYFGIFRSYTIKLRFVKDGARLLRSIFYEGGSEYQVGNSPACMAKLKIYKLDKVSLTYAKKYEGIIDWSTINDQRDYVEVTALDNNLSSLIKSNQENEYELSFVTANSMLNPVFPSRIEFLYFSQLLAFIFDKVTEGGYNQGTYGLDVSALAPFQSEIEFRYGLTNHAALKSLPFVKAKTTFKKLMKTLFTICQITCSVEIINNKETLVLYPLASVFPNETIYSTLHATDFKLSMASDYLFSRVLTGHPTQEYDDSSRSENEFNVETEWKLPNLSTINNDLELVSAYRADHSGINISIADQKTLPDEDELIIVVMRTHFEGGQPTDLELQPGFLRRDGVNFPLYRWNTRISPKRIALLHERFLASCRYGEDPASLAFVGSFFNNSLNETMPDEATIPPTFDYTREAVGYQFAASPIFRPFYFEFESDLPDDMIDRLQASPYGKVEFRYLGNTYSGFLINVPIKLHGKASAKFKLLASPDTDLTKLIH